MNKIIYTIACLLIVMSGWSQVPKQTGSKLEAPEAQEALDHHNKVRKDVGSPPLEWSAEIAAYAQEWADHLAQDGCEMVHRSSVNMNEKGYGENIYWSSGRSKALSASLSWYSEISLYHGEAISMSNFSGFGHYTQMVWKKTTKVGIGKTVCANGSVIIVANYDPAGNFIGQKPY